MVRFLIAMLVWNLGTGIFNPFLNVFFARRMHMPSNRSVRVLSVADRAGRRDSLRAVVFRRFGVTRGISGMEFATALALLALGGCQRTGWAAAAYCGFMMSQYMSEPGMFTLLMDGVTGRASATARPPSISWCRSPDKRLRLRLPACCWRVSDIHLC